MNIIGQEKATNTCFCTYTFVQKVQDILVYCICVCVFMYGSHEFLTVRHLCSCHDDPDSMNDVCGEFRELDHWLFVNCLTPF